MSAHVSSFPFDAPYNRDLSDLELWERSLRRSRAPARDHRGRAQARGAPEGRGGRGERVDGRGPDGGPVAPRSLGRRARPRPRDRRGRPWRSAIELPSDALVSYGDTGEAVVAVQRQVGVDDDGIFGPITRGAVERFQARYGLPVTGAVDARTWTALFKSNISFVGGGGKTVMTVYQPRAPRSAPATPDGSAPAATRPDDDDADAARAAHDDARAPTRAGRVATSTDAAPRRSRSTTTPRPRPPRPRRSRRRRLRRGPASARRSAARRPASTARAAPGHAHAGKDIAAPTGTAVRAAQCGTVTQAGARQRRLRQPRLHPARGRRVHVLRPPLLDRDHQGRLRPRRRRDRHASAAPAAAPARTCTSRSARTTSPSTRTRT